MVSENNGTNNRSYIGSLEIEQWHVVDRLGKSAILRVHCPLRCNDA